jgi:hypothetical protein
MVGETHLNDLVALVLGTSAMLIMLMAIIVLALVFQRKLIRKERLYRDIEKLLQKQELTSAYAVIEGQEEERKRIAADIHDNIGSLLASLKIYSDLVLRHDNAHEHARLNQRINELAETLAVEVRKIAHSLDTNTITNFGLKPAIEQLCEAVRNSDTMTVECFVTLDSPIAPPTALHIYRILQELFTNTLRHARATALRSEVTQTADYVSIIHEDNGLGFDVAAVQSTSMGLKNIRSRIGQLNGELRIESSPGGGSTFLIEIPLPKPDPHG